MFMEILNLAVLLFITWLSLRLEVQGKLAAGRLKHSILISLPSHQGLTCKQANRLAKWEITHFHPLFPHLSSNNTSKPNFKLMQETWLIPPAFLYSINSGPLWHTYSTAHLYNYLPALYFGVVFICMCVQPERATEKCLQVYFFWAMP